VNLALLHLSDSLFPIGAFAYSDGLESATSDGRIATAGDLRVWLDVCLDETIGRLEGPAVWRAWRAALDGDRRTLQSLAEELYALRPSSAARRSSRAMGARLVTTWSALHPTFERALEGLRLEGLPIAYAAACAGTAVGRRDAVESFAYTRLAATVSAAMRLMPIGQTDAHAALARQLGRVPAVVDGIVERDGPLESFAPALDIETMRQQYLHSRLFRS
jgi:urease accessory protein